MTQTRSVEWLLAAMMVAWGVGLLLPGDTMALTQYRLLRDMAPEFVWAAWSIGIGGLRFVALYVNGSWRRTPLIRAGCAVFGIIWWLLLAVLFIPASVGPMPAGLMWFPVFIIFEGYSAFRGARDAYHSGALQKWSMP